MERNCETCNFSSRYYWAKPCCDCENNCNWEMPEADLLTAEKDAEIERLRKELHFRDKCILETDLAFRKEIERLKADQARWCLRLSGVMQPYTPDAIHRHNFEDLCAVLCQMLYEMDNRDGTN